MILSVSGLEKSFGKRRVLAGVDLAVEAGECVALVGGNGSGKTTTLRAIAGLARPDAGRIEICGIDAVSDGRAARRHLSYLPQRPAFPGTLTVRETVELVARLRALSASRVDEEIERCELSELAGANVANLSGGERQRLALACALLPDAELALFDEPSSNLDARATGIFLARAREITASGRSLLFTTHIPADLEHLAGRVVSLSDGRVRESRLRVLAGGQA
ncbi:MAG TPA: ABC transporter ATP-binding protein [Thermoanaerobaculia bacterium]|nr:ABC transporter ATP-binding protein [Thermoanaerobaculia bacterium]